jgi:hypothetical protein
MGGGFACAGGALGTRNRAQPARVLLPLRRRRPGRDAQALKLRCCSPFCATPIRRDASELALKP